MSTCGVASVRHLECLLRAYVDWYYLASCVCNTGIKFVSATKLVIVAACNFKTSFSWCERWISLCDNSAYL